MLTLEEINKIVENCVYTYVTSTTIKKVSLIGFSCPISYNPRFTGKFGVFKLWKSTPWSAEIELSSQLFNLVPKTKQRNTVIHELCHAIQYWEQVKDPVLFPKRLGNADPHGNRWQILMKLFGEEPNRVGIIPEGVVPPGSVKMVCKCGVKTISKNRATRIKNGSKYYCIRCKELLKKP
jgi:predicted SprT family Zn-dependent metalloprotease